ncbi:DUF6602 domain-containing protein [Pontibacter indicus]|uniref:DUF6602 domain-containing protein n=1 Tax=Pontibacter indicus TaxID=1317125 RepID=A0A1R3XSR5_9BACT|nr:DUF6602 domain-containing protein [Pontibacter indicus]SIT94655.1 hypothetical protein SAMN05444128_3696 [Pontibacter indicus]
MMNTLDFHKSTAAELLALTNRVRNLVRHWGEDGRYKEAVLKSVIQRFLPEKYRISTGFVVKQTNQRGTHESSNQIDLLIYDTSYPVLFREGDFVIVTPDAVEAIIEVKANITNQGLLGVINKANEVGEFIYNGRSPNSKPIFNGIFSYAANVRQVSTLREAIETSSHAENFTGERCKYMVSQISFNKDYFYKFWQHEQLLDNPAHYIYELHDLSFSFFISNLTDFLSGTSVFDNNHLWYPVDKSIQVRSHF